ncbi:MAG: hypothetical protein ABDH21_02620 [bacterium]
MNFDELIRQLQIENERYKRYKTPCSIVIFFVNCATSSLQVQYGHKIVIELKNLIDKAIRKTDYIARHKNTVITILPNIDIEKVTGFVNRIFSLLDSEVKKNYKEYSEKDQDEMVLVDIVIGIGIICFSNLIPEGVDNIVIWNDFNKDSFLEYLSNPEIIYESWEIRFPVID